MHDIGDSLSDDEQLIVGDINETEKILKKSTFDTVPTIMVRRRMKSYEKL